MRSSRRQWAPSAGPHAAAPGTATRTATRPGGSAAPPPRRRRMPPAEPAPPAEPFAVSVAGNLSEPRRVAGAFQRRTVGVSSPSSASAFSVRSSLFVIQSFRKKESISHAVGRSASLNPSTSSRTILGFFLTKSLLSTYFSFHCSASVSVAGVSWAFAASAIAVPAWWWKPG